MREICTSGSVRGWGERSPQPTRTLTDERRHSVDFFVKPLFATKNPAPLGSIGEKPEESITSATCDKSFPGIAVLRSSL